MNASNAALLLICILAVGAAGFYSLGPKNASSSTTSLHTITISQSTTSISAANSASGSSCFNFVAATGPQLGPCKNITMNYSGVLKIAFAPQYVYYGNPAPAYIWGVACVNDSLLSLTNNTARTVYNNVPPPFSAFMPVNITISPSSISTVYFQCPLNSYDPKKRYDFDLWAYYGSQGSNYANLTELVTVSVTGATNMPLGGNINGGNVPSQSQLSLPSELVVSADNPADYVNEIWSIWLDNFPGEYNSSTGTFNNSASFYELLGSGSSVYYPIHLGGKHVIYFDVWANGTSYGNYSGIVTIGNGTTYFSGVNYFHMLSITVDNGIVTHNGIITFNGIG